MGKRVVYPITRIEGHGGVEFEFDSQGDFTGLKLLMGSFRGFEKILVGRPIEDVPRIVTRICGLCPWAHHLCSVKAIEDALGIRPPKRAVLLRRLALNVAHVADKALHFFCLTLPDLLSMEGEKRVLGLKDVLKKEPGLMKDFSTIRGNSEAILAMIGGKAIHPVTCIPGGIVVGPGKDQIRDIKKRLKVILQLSIKTLRNARKRLFVPLLAVLEAIPFSKTGFLGTVNRDGALELYDGDLKISDPHGRSWTFPARDYQEHLKEEVVDWSYSKLVKTTLWRHENSSHGIYRTNALSRLNVATCIPTPVAQDEFIQFKERAGSLSWHPLLYHWARLIEMVYCAEEALNILEAPKILQGPLIEGISNFSPGHGIGALEAPRGTLIHHYQLDEKGRIAWANLIVGTTHNIAPMWEDAAKIAQTGFENGLSQEDIEEKIFLVIRAHDP